MEITRENIVRIAPHLVGVLEGWGLAGEQIIEVLGLTGEVRARDLRKLRSGSKQLSYSEDLAQRIDHIIGITEAMRTTFPHSQSSRARWLRQKNRRLGRQRPLDMIFETGVAGLTRVRVELDCAYGWSEGEAHYAQNYAK